MGLARAALQAQGLAERGEDVGIPLRDGGGPCQRLCAAIVRTQVAVGHAEPDQADDEVGLEPLDQAGELRGLFVSASEMTGPRHAGGDDRRHRVQLAAALGLVDRLVEAAFGGEPDRIPEARVRVAGVELDGAVERLPRRREVPAPQLRVTECRVRLGQVRIQFEGPPRRRHGSLQGFPRRAARRCPTGRAGHRYRPGRRAERRRTDRDGPRSDRARCSAAAMPACAWPTGSGRASRRHMPRDRRRPRGSPPRPWPAPR